MTVKSDVDRLVEVMLEVVATIYRVTDASEVPGQSRSFTYMKATSATASEGVTFERIERYPWMILKGVENHSAFQLVMQSLADLIEVMSKDTGQQSQSSFDEPADWGKTAANKLIVTYLREAPSRRWNNARAIIATKDLINHIQASDVEARAIVLIRGFSAISGFKLGQVARFRKITKADLEEFALPVDQMESSLWLSRLRIPNTADWIIEIRVRGPKGKFTHLNEAGRIARFMPQLLRLVGSGSAELRMIHSRDLSPYSGMGVVSSTREESTSTSGQPLLIGVTSIRKMKKHWNALFELFEGEGNHWLIEPGRRLEYASERRRHVDSLVDCIIGLESLFGESGETAFKVRMRGSMVLGKTLEDRQNWERKLNTLYTLRSEIVHTGAPKEKSLKNLTLLDWAELAQTALRSSWWWAYDRYLQEPDRTALIRGVDALLLK